MLDKLAYRVDLDADDRAAVLALPHLVKTLPKNSYIVRQGDRTRSSCVMLSGFSYRSKIVGDGHRQIIAIHMKGDLVDLQNSFLEVADHSVQLLTEGQIAMVPREDVAKIAFERPAVGKAMWMDTLVDAAILREWIANVGRRDAKTRIAHLFCELGLRMNVAGLNDGKNYNLPMSQEQLADTCGLTPVHVNRMIRLLQSEGLIARPAPRTIAVDDWRRLADACDFDASYLHLRQDDPALA